MPTIFQFLLKAVGHAFDRIRHRGFEPDRAALSVAWFQPLAWPPGGPSASFKLNTFRDRAGQLSFGPLNFNLTSANVDLDAGRNWDHFVSDS
jgi:hypothetical protein